MGYSSQVSSLPEIGDTSTNDTVMLFATGKAGAHAEISRPADRRLVDFRNKLYEVMKDLAKQIVRDGEGAQKFITVRVKGATTYGAAKKIGHVEKGVGKVRIEHLGRDMRYAKRIPYSSTSLSGLMTVQVGSFTDKSNAKRLKKGLRHNYSDVFISTALINGRKYHRVRVGKFKNHDTAHSLAKKLAREGYSTHITSR